MVKVYKNVCITGAGNGIGRAIAIAMSNEGYNVVCADIDLKQAKDTLDFILNRQGSGIAVETDVTKAFDIKNMINLTVDEFGSLDILVNNAGVLLTGNLFVTNSTTVSDKDIKETFQTNLFSVISLTQALLPLIKKSDAGRIVNVSTILSSLTLHSAKDSPIAPAKEFAYNASKTALNAFTIHLALELKDTNIKVNSGHPGWVKTELGGPNAPMEVKDSYETSLYLATLDKDGPSGGLFHKGETLPW